MAEGPAQLASLGREQALTVLFRREHARLVAYARHLVDDLAAAEDVVQDAFAGLHRHWSGLRDEHEAMAYLRVSVANGARSQLRRRRTARGFRPLRPVDAPSAEHVVVRAEQHSQVLDGLARLPLRQRQVLVLRYFFDLTEAQIAGELDISKGSVKQHASRGLAALGGRVGAAL